MSEDHSVNFKLKLNDLVFVPKIPIRAKVVARMEDEEGHHYCVAIPHKKGYIVAWYTEKDLELPN